MKTKTAQKLNELNQRFYQTTAEHFDSSRQYYWAGWEKLLPILEKHFADTKSIRVLDVGCGNGRFGSFIQEKLEIQADYSGIDSNQDLLDIAAKRSGSISLIKTDIVEDLLRNKFLDSYPRDSYNLIVMFGVWHHIPSAKHRRQLLRELQSMLAPNGLLIFSVWQFYEFERFRKKIIDPTQAGLNPEELEKNDYILDWKRGVEAFRYSHYSPAEEIENSLSNFSNLKLSISYRADGEDNRSNLYYVLEKKPEKSVQ